MDWKNKCDYQKCSSYKTDSILSKPQKFKSFSDYELLCNTCDEFKECKCDCCYPHCYTNLILNEFKNKVLSINDIVKSKCDDCCDSSYCWNCVNSHAKKLYVPLEVVIHLLKSKTSVGVK